MKQANHGWKLFSRGLIALIAAAPLIFGTAVASAQTARDDGFPLDGQAAVAGTVVSTDAAANSFVANA